jgi:hypothetical protein
MKKAVMILICLSVSHLLLAQEATRQKEIGLVFNNFDNFGLTFKTGTEKAMWRFNTLSFNGNFIEKTNNNDENEEGNLGFGLNIGREYRTIANEKLELRIGADLSFRYQKYKSEDLAGSGRIREDIYYYPGINMVLGLNYLISDNLLFGAEVLPSVSYVKGTREISYPNQPVDKDEEKGFTWGFTNKWVLISIAYRF